MLTTLRKVSIIILAPASLIGLSYLGYGDPIFMEIQENLLIAQIQENYWLATIEANKISDLINQAKAYDSMLRMQQELQSFVAAEGAIEKIPDNHQSIFVRAYHNVEWFVYNHHGYIFCGVCISLFLLYQYLGTLPSCNPPTPSSDTDK
jgi:hypothetical protein